MPLVLRLAVAVFALAVCACGGPPPGAIVGEGTVLRAERGGNWAPIEAGKAPFAEGDTLKAEGGPAKLVIACVGVLAGSATVDHDPAGGMALVELSEGAQFHRRSGSIFELVSGDAHIRTGPLAARFVLFHGLSFVEVYEGHADNSAGASLRATTDGEAWRIDVETGALQLLNQGATPMKLDEVKLVAGEAAACGPGERPAKIEAGD